MSAFTFASDWSLNATRETVYDVLQDVERYPLWWPHVRAVVRLAEDAALVLCRSTLPKNLYLELRPVVQDRGAGVLEASLDGDLVGWSRFSLISAGGGEGGLTVSYRQEVDVGSRGLAAAAKVGRPLLAWNHEQMMRSLRRGLAAQAASPGP